MNKAQIKSHLPGFYRKYLNILKLFKSLNPFISRKFIYLFKYDYWDIRKFKKRKLMLNLVLIGGEKAGSTFLHNHLDLHPNIFMSKPKKEPCFFMPNDYFDKFELKKKEKEFIFKNDIIRGYKGQRVIGESTPDYSASNFAQKYMIPKRIFQYNKEMKILFILRNPLQRIVSDYMAVFRNDRETGSLAESIKTHDYLLNSSLYFCQLSQYLNYFEKEQVHITILEEINNDPIKEFNKIFSFLGVNEFEIDNLKTINKASNKAKFNKKDLLFNQESYDEIIPLIMEDVNNMKKYLNRPIDLWDLSSTKWVK